MRRGASPILKQGMRFSISTAPAIDGDDVIENDGKPAVFGGYKFLNAK